jgi:hypothetical protein
MFIAFFAWTGFLKVIIYPSMISNNLTPAQLRRAADIMEKIESLQHQLSQLDVSTGATEASAAPARRGRRAISAEGIARIKAAQKKRWAKARAAADGAQPAKRGGHRKMSAAGRAAIAAAARARWARVRAAKAGK